MVEIDVYTDLVVKGLIVDNSKTGISIDELASTLQFH